jgi:hypothetical protein
MFIDIIRRCSGIIPPKRRRANPKMEEEMRRLRMRLDAMETTQRKHQTLEISVKLKAKR